MCPPDLPCDGVSSPNLAGRTGASGRGFASARSRKSHVVFLIFAIIGRFVSRIYCALHNSSRSPAGVAAPPDPR